TDFYFVITNFFGCKSLMQDTQIFLRNLLWHAFGSRKRVDQSHIPMRERRVIRVYSVLLLFGRRLALFPLLFITLPLLFRYLHGAGLALARGYRSGNHYDFFDSLIVATLNLLPLILGLSLWINSMVRRKGVA